MISHCRLLTYHLPHFHYHHHTVTPVIEDISDTTEVNITNSASLACLTTAFPLVSSITWQKNGEDLLNLNGRISAFKFEINDTYISSGFLGNDSIESIVSMAGFSEAQVDGLGDLGVVGVLTFDSVVREDTDSYTCTATNFLPETAALSTVSDPVLLVVLGECVCVRVCVIVYTVWLESTLCKQEFIKIAASCTFVLSSRVPRPTSECTSTCQWGSLGGHPLAARFRWQQTHPAVHPLPADPGWELCGGDNS